MKAVRVHQYGGPEVLQYEDVPMPEPGPGEVRIHLKAIGLNYIDTYQRSGLYPIPLPFTPGMEGAGLVDALGAGVTQVRPGDRVAYAMIRGSYAEYAVVPASKVVVLPDHVDFRLAAAVMLQGLTAHFLTRSTYPLKKGDVVLFHAASSGLGLLFLQMAKALGATVYGTVSTDEKARMAREAGADEVILYTQVDFAEEVKRLTGGRGVDVVYDSVGKDTFDRSLSVLKPRGYLVLCGQSSGAVQPVAPSVLAKASLYLTRPMLNDYVEDQAELRARAADVFRWLRSGELKVRIGAEFPLAQAAEANRVIQDRNRIGKLLLIA